jgi:tripartite-type tricarboxylate transporter receptor subunit TctC
MASSSEARTKLMRTVRRHLAFTALFVLACASAHGQAYPTKPIHIIVPYPAGGGTDIVARAIAQKLTKRLGRSVMVENRAGANGVIGTEAGAKAAPDGYTLLMATPGPVTIAKGLIPNLPHDPERDFAAVSLSTQRRTCSRFIRPCQRIP